MAPAPSADVVDPGTFSMYLQQALLTKVPDLFSKSIQQYRSHAARVAKRLEMGGVVASSEIRRQIDQCVLSSQSIITAIEPE